MQKQKVRFVTFMRNFIFGAEDSLVSTVGLLSGIKVGGMEKEQIVLTGIVLIFVEAFSMAVGSFLSEYSTEEYLEKDKVRMGLPLAGGAIMFASYLFMGLVPLWPYVAFTADQAFYWSIISSVVGLMALGLVSARFLKINLVRNGLRMMVMGAIAIGVGAVVATLVN